MDAVDDIQKASIKLNETMRNHLTAPADQSMDQFHDAIGEEPGETDEPREGRTTEEKKLESVSIVEQLQSEEPKERTELPWFKDPNIKVSIWAIIKDSIGKDISKMSVPVYFNDPTSLLQKCAQSMEYNHIIDRSLELKDKYQRLAYLGAYAASQLTTCERTATKPFNPLLGETYEMVTDEFEFLSEQVSHHPPITANYCKGKSSNYTLWNNQKTNTKFTGKCLDFI